MMIRLIFVLGAAVLSSSGASARSYDDIMKEAQAAFVAEDYATAAARLDEAQIQRPYSLYLTRNRILTRLLTGRDGEAIAIAADVAERGLVLETPPHEAFDRMRLLPEFKPVAERMAANAAPAGTPAVKQEFPESGLLPEAISLRKGRLLIGSVRTGEIKDASAGLSTVARLDGGVFDIEQGKKSIFAALNNQLAFERRADAPPFAAIVELDPKSGAERRRVRIVAADALLGDIEIDKRGALYASDSLRPRVFTVDAGGHEARVLATDERWANPQGLAYDRRAHRLFLADYLTGLFVIDARTGAVQQVANPSNAHLGGIDGLYLHNGDLIGVQNGTSPQRIVRIDLDSSGLVAGKLEVLAQNLEGWNEPTHGVIDGDAFHYIATSNWPAYDDEGKVRDGAVLAPLRVMTISLTAAAE